MQLFGAVTEQLLCLVICKNDARIRLGNEYDIGCIAQYFNFGTGDSVHVRVMLINSATDDTPKKSGAGSGNIRIVHTAKNNGSLALQTGGLAVIVIIARIGHHGCKFGGLFYRQL